MVTKKEKRFIHINIGICLLFLCVSTHAQVGSYLTDRVKVGDLLYLDGGGNEHFIDYRLWDQDDPPGEPLGVVVYSYYGTAPFAPSGEPAWHGWIMEIGQSSEMAWAPSGSPCFSNCVSLYAVSGVNTPYNPHFNSKSATGDTCGWQNTYRFLEFLYASQSSVLSTDTSPVFHYVFSEKNGVTDFSTKPTMAKTSWYLPAFGQLRVMYGSMGTVNAALNACGGTIFTNSGFWWSSSEVGTVDQRGIWSLNYGGISTVSNNWLKSMLRWVRAFRNF